MLGFLPVLFYISGICTMGIVCLNFLAAKKHKKIKNTSSRDFFCRFRGENRNYSVVLGVKIRNYSVVLGVKIRNYSFVLGRENRNYSIFSCRFGVDVSPTRHSRLFQKREKLHFSNTFAPDFYIFPTRLR